MTQRWIPGPLLGRFSIPLLGLTLAGCDPVQAPAETLWTGPQAGGERIILDPEWEQVWVLGGEGDDLLARPADVTPRPGGAVLLDSYDQRIVSVERDGTVAWGFGGPGEGPGEFQMVQDIQVDQAGVVHVLDRESSRITRLSPQGVLLDELRTPPGVWFSLVAVEDGYVLESPNAQVNFQYLPVPKVSAESGASDVTLALETVGFDMPWPGFRALDVIQRQGQVIAAADGRWIYAFSIGNGWFAHEGSRALDYYGQNVEHSEFPGMIVTADGDTRSTRLTERQPCSVCSGWILGDTISLHFGGRTEDRLRIVDRYDWDTGRYLNSLRLPGRAHEVTRVGDLYLLLEGTPWPTVTAWRIVD